jgi:sulfoxide reductase heme-binding subunit YedZ
LHFLAYAGVDQRFAPGYILEDIVERPYITLGFAAFLLLIPLAATSTRGMIRRLGSRWKKLHRLVYPAAILGVWHYYWLVKADVLQPLIYAALLILLLALRLRKPTPKRVRTRSLT